MKPQQPPPTRQAVLAVHAEEYRRRTGCSHEEWAERVDATYCARVPEPHRHLPAPDLSEITDGDVHRKLRRAWDQMLRRFDSGELRMPVELEEAWVYALDEPYRSNCIRELANRYGCYGARIRHANASGDHASWGDALRDFGEITVAMGQILADGRMDAEDEEHIPPLLERIARMQADLESLRRHALAAAGGEEDLPLRLTPTGSRA